MNNSDLTKNLIGDGGLTAILRSVAIIGDSLSSGTFESTNADGTTDYHDFYDYSWGQFLAHASGITVHNLSHGGMTAHDFLAEFDARPDWRVSCNAYVIFLGENDLYQGLKIGSVDNLNEDSYISNLNAIIGICRKLQPQCRIFLTTVPHDDLGPERNGAIDVMRENTVKLAAMHDFCYVIDLAGSDFLCDNDFRQKYAMGIHPTPSGYFYMSRVIGTCIDRIISENFEDFKQIGFVGTNLHNNLYK